MKTSRLTVKGQVTLPLELRRRFGLGPGSRVAFEEKPDGIRVRPVRETILNWGGSLPSPQAGRSDAEIRRLVKKSVAVRTARKLAHD